MANLGYTWYPKDFISDPEVMMMTALERGVYRDLIDLAYLNDNLIKYSIDQLAHYCKSNSEVVHKILKIKGEKKGDFWTIPSCQKRIDLANKNRENGKKGGRPKTQTKPKPNPELTQTIRQKKEKEREKEIKTNKDRVYNGILKKETSKPPSKEEFIQLGIEKRKGVSKEALALKYDSQVEQGWLNGNGEQITNWRSWLIASLAYLPLEKKEEPKPFIRTYKEYKG